MKRIVPAALLAAASLAACHTEPTAPGGLQGNADWQISDRAPTSDTLFGVWARSSSDIFAVGDSGAIIHYDGRTWSAMSAPTTPGDRLYAVWGTGTGDVYAVGARGSACDDFGCSRALHYDGHAWMDLPIELSIRVVQLNGVWAASSHDVFAVGIGQGSNSLGIPFIAHFDGVHWAAMTLPDTVSSLTQLYGVWGTSPTNVYAVGSYGVILHYNGGAWSLEHTTSPRGFDYRSVWGSGTNDVFVVGDGEGQAVAEHYNGSAWSPLSVPVASRFTAVAGSGPSDVNVLAMAGANLPYTLHYDGSAWTMAASVGPYALHGIAVSGHTAFAVGASGIVLQNAGTGWTVKNRPGMTLVDAWAASPDSVLVLASDGSLLASTAAAGSWRWVPPVLSNAFAPFGMNHMWSAPSASLFASSYVNRGRPDFFAYGGVYRFDGTAWQPMVPDLPPDAAATSIWGTGANDIYASAATQNGHGQGALFHFDGTAWTSVAEQAVQGFAGGWGSSAHDIFAGFNPGVIHFDGSTWTQMTLTPPTAVVAVWGSSATDVFAAGSSNIFHYDGSQWTVMTTAAAGVRALDGSGPKDVYAVGDHLALHYDGSAWSPVDVPVDGSWRNVRVVAPGNVYIVGDNRTILHGGAR
jgi:hypothetical protein